MSGSAASACRPSGGTPQRSSQQQAASSHQGASASQRPWRCSTPTWPTAGGSGPGAAAEVSSHTPVLSAGGGPVLTVARCEASMIDKLILVCTTREADAHWEWALHRRHRILTSRRWVQAAGAATISCHPHLALELLHCNQITLFILHMLHSAGERLPFRLAPCPLTSPFQAVGGEREDRC